MCLSPNIKLYFLEDHPIREWQKRETLCRAKVGGHAIQRARLRWRAHLHFGSAIDKGAIESRWTRVDPKSKGCGARIARARCCGHHEYRTNCREQQKRQDKVYQAALHIALLSLLFLSLLVPVALPDLFVNLLISLPSEKDLDERNPEKGPQPNKPQRACKKFVRGMLLECLTFYLFGL